MARSVQNAASRSGEPLAEVAAQLADRIIGAPPVRAEARGDNARADQGRLEALTLPGELPAAKQRQRRRKGVEFAADLVALPLGVAPAPDEVRQGIPELDRVVRQGIKLADKLLQGPREAFDTSLRPAVPLDQRDQLCCRDDARKKVQRDASHEPVRP